MATIQTLLLTGANHHGWARSAPFCKALLEGLVHMHGVPYHVLATAWSDPATRGSGRHEPMMVTTQYGAGRVYHHVLGHVWPGDPEANKGCTTTTFENPGFQKALLRGCEWAATGEVMD